MEQITLLASVGDDCNVMTGMSFWVGAGGVKPPIRDQIHLKWLP